MFNREAFNDALIKTRHQRENLSLCPARKI